MNESSFSSKLIAAARLALVFIASYLLVGALCAVAFEILGVDMNGILLIAVLSIIAAVVTWVCRGFFRSWRRVAIALVGAVIASSLAYQFSFAHRQNAHEQTPDQNAE